MNMSDVLDDTGLFFDDPAADCRLDEVPDSIRNAVRNIAAQLEARGRAPAPERIAQVMENLGLEPLDAGLLQDLLMEPWRAELDTVDFSDVRALQAHLRAAPVPGHRWGFYVMGLIAGVTLNGLNCGYLAGGGNS